MIEVTGTYNSAKVFTDNIEETATAQLTELCNQEFVEGCKIRVMPDVHAGAGCVIGFTADLGDKVIPNIVGVDIGCGMLCVEMGKKIDESDFTLERLDNIIRKHIPAGMSVHEGRVTKFPKLQELYCFRELKDTKRIERSIGTLGSGNHFIEVNADNEGDGYLVIHSGSRNLGKQVAEHYQNLAVDLCRGMGDYYEQREKIIKECKENGEKQLIQGKLKDLKTKYDTLEAKYPKDLCFLTSKYRDMYLHDMEICQEYASLNRYTMASIILKQLFGGNVDFDTEFDCFQTVHNYINFKDNIIRKGSISAYADEKVLIPLNMRDGSLICKGKGNADWNYSAPHGAGRLMSRSQARKKIDMDDYRDSMKGIYTTSVNEDTIDESPFAYKPMDEIIGNIGDTVTIVKHIKPIYNFKAGE